MNLDELSLVVRRLRRISKDSSSRHIMRLLPVSIPKTYDHVCSSSSRRIMRLKYKHGVDELSFWTDNVSSSIKTANIVRVKLQGSWAASKEKWRTRSCWNRLSTGTESCMLLPRSQEFDARGQLEKRQKKPWLELISCERKWLAEK